MDPGFCLIEVRPSTVQVKRSSGEEKPPPLPGPPGPLPFCSWLLAYCTTKMLGMHCVCTAFVFRQASEQISGTCSLLAPSRAPDCCGFVSKLQANVAPRMGRDRLFQTWSFEAKSPSQARPRRRKKAWHEEAYQSTLFSLAPRIRSQPPGRPLIPRRDRALPEGSWLLSGLNLLSIQLEKVLSRHFDQLLMVESMTIGPSYASHLNPLQPRGLSGRSRQKDS
ncbi:hypothetical protein VTK56DRAFT_335 [Thermocarpiscus australiensis]